MSTWQWFYRSLRLIPSLSQARPIRKQSVPSQRRIGIETLESRELLAVGDLLHTLVSSNPTPQADTRQGHSVATSADYRVCGVPYADVGGYRDTGVVKVYSATSNDIMATLANPTPANEDYFGYSVALSGHYLVVGAYGDDTGASNAGSAYVYDLSSATPTTPIATLNSPTLARDDYFGYSVAVSGNQVVVGAIRDDTRGYDAGAVYVYDLGSATPTVPVVMLKNPAPTAGDDFGFSVAVRDEWVVVGAPHEDWGASSAGAAYLYKLTSSSPDWPAMKIQNPEPGSYDLFGSSVAVSAEYVVVGAPSDGPRFSNIGSAYVFDIAPSIPATLVATLNNPTPADGEYFGTSVAVSGDYVMVDSPRDDGNVGAAYVYDLDSVTPTTPMTTLNNPAPGHGSFGRSVAASGNSLVVGATSDEAGGSAYVYDLASATPTAPVARLNDPVLPASLDHFGDSVAVSGNYMVVGAPQDDSGASNTGAAYVYDLTSPTPDTSSITLNNPTPDSGDLFGDAVAISGNYVVVGAPFDDTGPAIAGSAYVYDLDSVTPDTPIATLSNPAPALADQFGSAVSVFGSYVIVGVPRDDTGASDAGSAYVYDLASATRTTPIAEFNNPTSGGNDNFGCSVAVSGNYAVVGAHSEGMLSTGPGSAYVYDLASATPTTPVATLNNPMPSTRDAFAYSVAVSGSFVVVGAPYDSTGATNSGSAYVYDLASATPATPIATLNNPKPIDRDYFGYSVALSGDYAVVGAYRDDTGASDAGLAYLYDLSSATPTTPIVTLDSPTPAIDDRFGCSVAVSDNYVVAGAYQDDTQNYNQGAAYVFRGVESDPAVHITGTENADTIIFSTNGTDHLVTVNGVPTSVVASQVYIDGLGGNDTITIVGTDEDEIVTIDPGSVDVDGETYEIHATNVEDITMSAGSGDDQVTMTGSAGSNRLYSYADYARLTDSPRTLSYRVDGFDEVTVETPSSGRDYAFLYDGPGGDVLDADPTQVVLTRNAGEAEETVTTAEGFQRAYIYATNGGADTAELSGSDTTRNRFYSYADYSILTESRRSFYFYARGFDDVTGNSSGTATTYAYLYDSPGNDTFEATTTSADLNRDVGWSDATATGFKRIYAYSTRGGSDTATLNGSATGGNRYRGYPTYSTLTDTARSFYHYARGFDSVTAVGSQPDTSGDRAYLYDSSGADTFDEEFLEGGKYQGGSLTNGSDTVTGTYENLVKYFDLVYARSTDSGTDDTITVDDEDLLAYILIRSGTW